MKNYLDYSIPELVKILGSRFKDYRMRSNMTQKEVSEQSGLTIATIHKFENGNATGISLSTFLSLMRAIGYDSIMDDIMPELPESAYLLKENTQKYQRVRHKKS